MPFQSKSLTPDFLDLSDRNKRIRISRMDLSPVPDLCSSNLVSSPLGALQPDPLLFYVFFCAYSTAQISAVIGIDRITPTLLERPLMTSTAK